MADFSVLSVQLNTNSAVMQHLYLPALLALFFITALSAQSPKIEDFRLAGDARRTGDNCIDLTYDRDWSSGSLWHREAISLDAAFNMELRVMLGCKDRQGADGMVFVFHPHDRRIGYSGEGMGFAGLRPSIGIEIDTWLNEHLGDPAEDHIALLRDGSVQHFDNNLAGPNAIPNIETCSEHQLQIRWSPGNQLLSVRLDGRRVLSYRGDLVRDIFRGKDKVYWGVTSGTGAYSNRQAICFEKLEFTLADKLKPLELSGEKAKRLMEGEFISLSNIQFESGSARLLPASKQELDELVRILQQRPKWQLDILGHTDNVGSSSSNLRLSKRRAKAVADYLKRKGVNPERMNARGVGEAYPKHSNRTKTGRLKNRRVEFRFTKPIA